MLTIRSDVKKIITQKFHDPLFYLALILLFFWILDAWYKIFSQHAPSRMLWYSSMGLGAVSIGLFLRSSLILTSVFSVLFFQEGIWNISFFSNLFSIPDYFLAAKYAFGKDFPPIALFITLFHLLLLPSIFYGLYKLKKIHNFGWLGGYIFALIVNYLPLFFPDREDVNCVRGQIASCRIFFVAFYSVNPIIGIFGGVTYQLFLIYIPSYLFLVNFFHKFRPTIVFFSTPLRFLKQVVRSPDFYLSILTFLLSVFWIADTFEKVSSQHAISRVFWWSSTGLLLIAIGLYRRSSLILTAMFCALFVIETLWSLSFLAYLFFGYKLPYLSFALYGFEPHYPLSSFTISLFHLFLVPGLLIGLVIIKKANPYGWLLALLYYFVTLTVAHFFPDKTENINCSRVINIICHYIYGLSADRTFYANLAISSFYQLVLFYLPLNFILWRYIKKKASRSKTLRIAKKN